MDGTPYYGTIWCGSSNHGTPRHRSRTSLTRWYLPNPLFVKLHQKISSLHAEHCGAMVRCGVHDTTPRYHTTVPHHTKVPHHHTIPHHTMAPRHEMLAVLQSSVEQGRTAVANKQTADTPLHCTWYGALEDRVLWCLVQNTVVLVYGTVVHGTWCDWMVHHDTMIP